jgi:glycosyltransferase involved in cell wall biosynthesis
VATAVANPLFSIIVPCHNGERWITDALKSCWRQNYRPLEVIVVDDGSTDHSFDRVSEYSAQRPALVNLLKQANKGAPAARMRGFQASSGNYVLFLDADDRLCDDALATLVGGFSKGADVSYGRARWIDETGAVAELLDQDPGQSGDPFLDVLEHHPITSSVAFRRDTISCCPWNLDLPCAQEFDLLIRCALSDFRFWFQPFVVAEIRRHGAPNRITNRTSSILASVAAKLTLSYRETLQEKGKLSEDRAAAVDYSLLSYAIVLYRQGRRVEARELIRRVDWRHARRSWRFKRLSYHAIALTSGLYVSHLAWLGRQRLRGAPWVSWK